MKFESERMDNDKITIIFTGIRQRLMNMAWRFLGNEEDAADMVQDAFCRLWQRRESFESSQKVEGVSMVTVRNLCIDSKRHKTVTSEIGLDENCAITESLENDSYDELERREAYDELNVIMERELSEVQLTIVRMREYEELSYEEIAKTLGMQPAAVRMQLSRARKIVREIYRNRNL